MKEKEFIKTTIKAYEEMNLKLLEREVSLINEIISSDFDVEVIKELNLVQDRVSRNLDTLAISYKEIRKVS